MFAKIALFMVTSHLVLTYSRIALTLAMVSAGKNESFVVAGSIVSFTENVGQQQREDVISSTPLAQLAADYKYDRVKNESAWYKFYDSVLGKIGYVVTSFNTPQQIDTSGAFTSEQRHTQVYS